MHGNLAALFEPRHFDELGKAVVSLLVADMGRVQDPAFAPVMPPGSPAALCERFPAEFSPTGEGEIVGLLRTAIEQSTRLHAPRFLGHQVATPLPAAALCDLVSSFLNNGMAVFEMGPASSAMERAVLSWLAQKAGLPSRSGGILTSGGSLGNLTALLAARQSHAGFDVWRRGLARGPALCVFVAETAHYSVARAARIIGLGDDGVIGVAVDEKLKMRTDALVEAIADARKRKRTPLAVVASAGSTAGGAFDPIHEVADICEKENLWLHVDGAHGASLLLSEKHQGKLTGIERADSIVWDMHKMMMMPALCTAVLFKDAKKGAAAFAQEAGYLFATSGDDDDAWSDIGKRTLECTKRMMSLAPYISLRAFGTDLFRVHVDKCCDLATSLAAKARARRLEVMTEPECNIVCFRPRGMPSGSVAGIRKKIVDDGRFYIVQVRRPDGIWLRCTLSHPLTTDADLDAIIDAVVSSVEDMRRVPPRAAPGPKS